MAKRTVQTNKKPIKVKLADGSLFVCFCDSTEFRITNEDAPIHLFCRCGQIFTLKDLPPLEHS